MAAVRLAHFSDVHVTTRQLDWRRGDWFTKRLPGWFNLRSLGRGRRFHSADLVLGELRAELHRRRPDHVVFSGDATALGFESELAHAAALLGLSEPDLLPGLAVPGNHDYYTAGVAASGLFERYFAAWQKGRRVDEHVYPFAQRVGHVWLVGVNSSTGNRWFWDAAGGVDAAQQERLERLLASLEPGPRILVTHYPVCREGGQRERPHHALRRLDDFVAVAARGGVCLWLHGHRHGPYYLACAPLAPFPVVCVGSATQEGHWSYNEYTIEGQRLEGLRRSYDFVKKCFVDREAFALELCEPV